MTVIGLTDHERFLDMYLGQSGRVAMSDGETSRIAFSDGKYWWFPNDVLQIVEDLSPGNLSRLFE